MRYTAPKQSDLRTGKCNIATCCICCFDTPIGMILLSALVTARRELSPPSPSTRPLSSLGFLFFFCYLYTKPSRVVAALRQTATTAASVAAAVARQQKISNKSFRNPASLLSASPDFHYLAFMPPPHPPKTLPLFSSVSPYRSPVKRDSTILPSLSVSFPGLTLPYFRHFFLFFYPFLSNLSVMPLLARSRSASFLLLFFLRLYLLFAYSVCIISPRSPRFDSNSSQRAGHAPIVFVSFAFSARPSIETSSPFMRTIITISGAANCN